MPQDDSKYTKPGLRESIKKRITAGSKGGKPGQWSARKAQMVASEYKKAGGGYKGGKGFFYEKYEQQLTNRKLANVVVTGYYAISIRDTCRLQI